MTTEPDDLQEMLATRIKTLGTMLLEKYGEWLSDEQVGETLGVKAETVKRIPADLLPRIFGQRVRFWYEDVAIHVANKQMESVRRARLKRG
jgi:hypothetical protein